MTQRSAAQHYIGTKQITAWPATRTITNDSHSEGSVEPGYAVQYSDGYTSWSPKDVFEAAYLPMGQVDHLAPHQQRVVGEKVQLDDKLTKLSAFLEGKVFASLPADEQDRLHAQVNAMARYSDILGQRIAAFGKEA